MEVSKTNTCGSRKPSSLKIMLGERSSYEEVPKEHWHYMKVLPVNFASEHKEMLGYSKLVLEKGILAINRAFDKLITSLRSAVSSDLGKLDKEATSYDIVLDSFRLALQMFRLKEEESRIRFPLTVEA